MLGEWTAVGTLSLGASSGEKSLFPGAIAPDDYLCQLLRRLSQI